MSIRRAVITISVLLSLGRVGICTDENAPWHLSDLIKRASDHVNDKDTSVETARRELDMLEALARTRVEFRPQLSLLSFSNPIFLAASLGGSISVNHRTAPSPVTMELARFGVVEAEVGRAQARITSRIETTGQFFAMAEAQDLAARACHSWNARTGDRQRVQSLVSLHRITRLDVIRFEQDVNSLESECVEAKAQVQTTALTLARLIGLDATPEQFQVSTADLSEVSAADLPTSNELILTAIDSQSDFGTINQHMSELATAGTKRKFHFDSFSAGYSYLKNAEQQYPDMGKQYLLGGNVGHVDAGFYFPLRRTGDEKATYTFLQARFDRVQKQLQDLKVTVRHEIEDNVQRSTLASDRLRLSQKKQQLANELHALTAERREVGLQPATDELWAQRDAERAEANTAHSELEWQRTAFTALALSHPDKLTSLTVVARKQEPPPVRPTALAPALSSKTLLASVTYPAPVPITMAMEAHTTPLALVDLPQLPAPKTSSHSEEPEHILPCAGHCDQQGTPTFVPPRPLKRVLPNAQRQNAVTIYTSTQIDVTVLIDQEGRVVEARVSNPQGSLNGMLVGQAIAAAKLWKFEPAKLQGRNIPCHHMITFLFRPRS